jgi:hypothetical protein
MTFEELNLAPAIVKAVLEQGYENPTPIQAQAIPAVLTGKDLLAGAQTGTGKTAAFSLPILHRLTQGGTSHPAGGIRDLQSAAACVWPLVQIPLSRASQPGSVHAYVPLSLACTPPRASKCAGSSAARRRMRRAPLRPPLSAVA